jgi:ATP phosphoribosyltransferase regulatory subunit
MTTQDRWLLPDGVEEILPGEARAIERLRRDVLDLFERWGYELVSPPLVEYLESLLTGVGGELDIQTFKLIDQMTGRLLGVRADITPQVARIDAHYLKRQAPARLCYVGSVLRTRPDELGGTREPLQLGAELYGHGGAAADAEVLALMSAALAVADIKSPHIDLGHVGIFRALVAHAGLSAEQEAAVFEALQRKARPEVEALLAQYGIADPARAWLLALLGLNGGPTVLVAARERLRGAPAAVGEALDNLEAMAKLAGETPGLPALHFDLAELAGYHYYTGVVFSAFVAGHGRAIARGGRYDGIGRAFGRSRPATGFGADLRELARLGGRATAPLTGILAPPAGDADLAREIARLRAAGERVVSKLPDDGSPATAFGCDRVLMKKNERWMVEKL